MVTRPEAPLHFRQDDVPPFASLSLGSELTRMAGFSEDKKKKVCQKNRDVSLPAACRLLLVEEEKISFIHKGFIVLLLPRLHWCTLADWVKDLVYEARCCGPLMAPF